MKPCLEICKVCSNKIFVALTKEKDVMHFYCLPLGVNETNGKFMGSVNVPSLTSNDLADVPDKCPYQMEHLLKQEEIDEKKSK